jgi:hypothetical protein
MKRCSDDDTKHAEDRWSKRQRQLTPKPIVKEIKTSSSSTSTLSQENTTLLVKRLLESKRAKSTTTTQTKSSFNLTNYLRDRRIIFKKHRELFRCQNILEYIFQFVPEIVKVKIIPLVSKDWCKASNVDTSWRQEKQTYINTVPCFVEKDSKNVRCVTLKVYERNVAIIRYKNKSDFKTWWCTKRPCIDGECMTTRCTCLGFVPIKTIIFWITTVAAKDVSNVHSFYNDFFFVKGNMNYPHFYNTLLQTFETWNSAKCWRDKMMHQLDIAKSLYLYREPSLQRMELTSSLHCTHWFEKPRIENDDIKQKLQRFCDKGECLACCKSLIKDDILQPYCLICCVKLFWAREYSEPLLKKFQVEHKYRWLLHFQNTSVVYNTCQICNKVAKPEEGDISFTFLDKMYSVCNECLSEGCV